MKSRTLSMEGDIIIPQAQSKEGLGDLKEQAYLRKECMHCVEEGIRRKATARFKGRTPLCQPCLDGIDAERRKNPECFVLRLREPSAAAQRLHPSPRTVHPGREARGNQI